jgi:hypothetical protein
MRRCTLTNDDGETTRHPSWRAAYRASDSTLEPHALPPAAWLYAGEPRALLVALIGSIEEELRVMPHSRFHAEKRSSRERGLAQYRRALARYDAAAASKPAVVN